MTGWKFPLISQSLMAQEGHHFQSASFLLLRNSSGRIFVSVDCWEKRRADLSAQVLPVEACDAQTLYDCGENSHINHECEVLPMDSNPSGRCS